MKKMIRVYDDKNKTIVEQLRFCYNFMYGKRDMYGVSSKKPFIEKFFSSHYGQIDSSKKMRIFYRNSELFFGCEKTYFNLIIEDDYIDFRKLKNFFNKVYPTLKIELLDEPETPRIEFIKFSFACIMYEGLELENRCDLDLSLTHRLTPDEVEVLMDTRDMFENGYMYRMNQYYCKTCLGHDSNRPIHLEFDPFA